MQISCAVTAQLISTFVFAIWIVQSLFYLNPKFQASSHLLWLYSPVCVDPGRKSRRPVFSQRGSYHNSNRILLSVSLIEFDHMKMTTSVKLCLSYMTLLNKMLFPSRWFPYKNEKVAARLQLGWCYYAAIKYVCNNWWRQSSQLERLVACLQQPCSFYQRLQAHRETTRSQLQLAAVTSKKTARTHSL